MCEARVLNVRIGAVRTLRTSRSRGRFSVHLATDDCFSPYKLECGGVVRNEVGTEMPRTGSFGLGGQVRCAQGFVVAAI